MGKFVEIMTYQGKEIIYLNLSGLNEEDQLKAIDEMDQIFSNKNDILAITNVENTTTSPAVKERADANYKKHNDRIKASALIGVSGLKKVLAQGIKRDIHFANSLDEAKIWLVQQ